MADQVFNIALGRAAELYNRVDLNDPANSALIVLAINTTASDSVLKDMADLGAVLADANTAEVTNSGYARKTLTDADIVAFAPDNVNNRVDLDIADQVWANVAAGSAWTDILICYDSDTTLGTDANIVPISQHDYVATPDGSTITATVNTFYRAS